MKKLYKFYNKEIGAYSDTKTLNQLYMDIKREKCTCKDKEHMVFDESDGGGKWKCKNCWDADHFNLASYNEKISVITEANYDVEPLDQITAIKSSGEVGESLNVEFNTEQYGCAISTRMEVINGEPYIFIAFIDEEDTYEKMFDTKGNEKVIEWCSNCNEEVVLDAVKFKKQVCPVCNDKIRACCLCNSKDQEKCGGCDDE